MFHLEQTLRRRPIQLSEHLRPTDLSDLVQPTTMIDSLERMAREGQLTNMLFYGNPGVGKTSAARILIKRVEADDYEINGSLDTGIDAIRDLVRWASSCSLFGKSKVCFVDECEFLSSNAQAALRGLIEKYPRVTFLMTANDIRKLDPALKSRCMPLCFDLAKKDEPEVIARLCGRYEERLKELGFVVDPTRLGEIVHLYFPDLRAIANRLEFEFARTKAA